MTFTKENGFTIFPRLRICSTPYIPEPSARGLWHFFSTYGLPLGDICSILLQKGLYPDWAYLIVEMSAEGWDSRRILSILRSELSGVYPPDIAATIVKGLCVLCAGELHEQ